MKWHCSTAAVAVCMSNINREQKIFREGKPFSFLPYLPYVFEIIIHTTPIRLLRSSSQKIILWLKSLTITVFCIPLVSRRFRGMYYPRLDITGNLLIPNKSSMRLLKTHFCFIIRSAADVLLSAICHSDDEIWWLLSYVIARRQRRRTLAAHPHTNLPLFPYRVSLSPCIHICTFLAVILDVVNPFLPCSFCWSNYLSLSL